MFGNSIISQSWIQHPIISSCQLRSLWYRLFWNPWWFFHILNCSLYIQSIILLWAELSVQLIDYPKFETKYYWLSIDVQFHVAVKQIWFTVLAEVAAIASYMNHSHKITHRLCNMQDDQLLLLDWCSFSGWDRERLMSVFAVKGGQYHIYGGFQLITSEVNQDGRPKVTATWWTLIFRMRQDVCRCYFYLWKQAIPHLLMFATNCHLHCRRCTARIIDAQSTMKFNMGHWPWCFRCCVYRMPIHLSCIAMMKSHCNYITNKPDNHRYSIDGNIHALYIQHLLLSIFASTVIWHYWLPFWIIETCPFGKAERSNVLVQVIRIVLKLIHVAQQFILSAILLSINQKLHSTA